MNKGSRPNSGDVRGQTPPAYLEPIGAPPSPTKKKKKKKKKQQEELPPPQAHGWGARPPGPAPPSTHAAQPPPLQGNILIVTRQTYLVPRANRIEILFEKVLGSF